MPMTRGDLRWRITIPDDGHRPGARARADADRVARRRASGGRAARLRPSLVALAGEHPEPATVRAALAALGLGDTLKVTYAKSPRLAAMIRTPRGVVTL